MASRHHCGTLNCDRLRDRPACGRRHEKEGASRANGQGNVSGGGAPDPATQTQNFTKPPRTIDDIANILGQHRPDPAKIKKLQETADKPTPPNLKGMALADFLYERSNAARDLGRTQQRLADIREAHKLSKQHALFRRPIWVADFPTPSNPMGSAAFQSFINAKRAAKMAARGPGPGGGGGPCADVTTLTSQERSRCAARMGAGGPGRPGGPGGPGPMAGKTNLDFMPKTPGGVQGALPEPGACRDATRDPHRASVHFGRSRCR